MMYSIVVVLSLANIIEARRLLQLAPQIVLPGASGPSPTRVLPPLPPFPENPEFPMVARQYTTAHPNPLPGLKIQGAPTTTTTSTTTAPPLQMPVIPASLPPLPIAPPLEMECVRSYIDIGSCAGEQKTIVNAGQNFKLNCAALGACAQTSVKFDFLPGGMVDRIGGVLFTEAYAGLGATITINNMQGTGNSVVLDVLECQGATACQDLNVILINAEVNDIKCDNHQDCANCWIKNGLYDPVPKACWGY